MYNRNSEYGIKNNMNLLLEKVSAVDIGSIDKNKLELLVDNVTLETEKIIDSAKIIFDKNNSNDLESSILKRVQRLLICVRDQKKLYAVSILRDKMATLKWEMYESASEEIKEENYWENYIQNQIDSTNGLYDYSIENIAEYKDLEDINSNEVFACLNNVELTKNNSHVLSLVKK